MRRAIVRCIIVAIVAVGGMLVVPSRADAAVACEVTSPGITSCTYVAASSTGFAEVTCAPTTLFIGRADLYVTGLGVDVHLVCYWDGLGIGQFRSTEAQTYPQNFLHQYRVTISTWSAVGQGHAG
jgi:hypothetical protein